jgi:Domain of unknown function (DUF6265)
VISWTVVMALSLADIGWLAGHWEMSAGSRCVEEHWTSPSSNLLVGMSRTVEGGRTTSFEFVRIEARADGIYYVAQPGGRAPRAFRLASDAAAELVFVNPGHADHLKRIVYRHQADGGLLARVEGEDAGRSFAVDYPYRRSPNSAASRCGAVK